MCDGRQAGRMPFKMNGCHCVRRHLFSRQTKHLGFHGSLTPTNLLPVPVFSSTSAIRLCIYTIIGLREVLRRVDSWGTGPAGVRHQGAHLAFGSHALCISRRAGLAVQMPGGFSCGAYCVQSLCGGRVANLRCPLHARFQGQAQRLGRQAWRTYATASEVMILQGMRGLCMREFRLR